MALTVKQRGQHVATFRSVEVRLMEILAAWIPSTPEMEAKLLFGPHVWDCAQAADTLGKRVHELRLPLHHSVPPVPGYVAVLDELAAVQGASRRIAALYDVVLPQLGERYRRYLADGHADGCADGARHRTHPRQPGACRATPALREQMPGLRPADGAVKSLIDAQAAVGEIVADVGDERQAA
jgi:hypothetical protein